MPSFDHRAILVVDDDPDALELYASAFAKHGADVRKAGSAEAAVAQLEGWLPDAVLCDLHLPGRDGYALLGDLRRIAGDVPVIAISGSHPSIERERALRAGFAVHFAKPTRLREILEATFHAIASSLRVRPSGVAYDRR